jgi:hypothetical protein
MLARLSFNASFTRGEHLRHHSASEECLLVSIWARADACYAILRDGVANVSRPQSIAASQGNIQTFSMCTSDHLISKNEKSDPNLGLFLVMNGYYVFTTGSTTQRYISMFSIPPN